MKTNCYLCAKIKECEKTLIYEGEKDEYNRVYLCLDCIKKRYGKEVNMGFKEERLKCRNLKFDINDILDNQYTQSGYDTKEALKLVIDYAKNKLEDLDN